MLTPHLQQSMGSLRPRSLSTSALRSSTSTLLKPGTAAVQARSLWWRRPCDYTSQIDPQYHRMSRYRTLKTRAKLLDKLRRRGRWDWDVSQRPFFNAKHIRWASHVGRPKWTPEQEQDKHEQKPRAQESSEADSFELSRREKEWKDHMEALRKRIHEDPYEAVFGRRFEPFWSPLVPSWMKAEMGLKDWSQPKDGSEAKANSSDIRVRTPSSQPAQASYRPLDPEPIKAKRQVDPSSGEPKPQSAPARYEYDPKKQSVDVSSDSPNGQQTSYSYGATTSWDSWTKKASRVEWDSVSGEKRRYEYDPISNRMVQIKGPPESEVRKVEDALKDYPARSESPLMSHGWQSGLGSRSAEPTTIEVPAKTSNETRHAISVPTQDSKGRKTSMYFPSLINTSVVADRPKPASLTKHERYPDALTAADVRASVGQKKAERTPLAPRDSSDIDRAYRHGKPDPRKMSEWEQAEHRIMLNQDLYDITKQKLQLLKQESGSFHTEKIQRQLAKLEAKASELHKELDAMDARSKKSSTSATSTARPVVDKMSGKDTVVTQPAVEKLLVEADAAPAAKMNFKTPNRIQPALESMRTEPVLLAEEPDDSAAHESTGEFGEYKNTDATKDLENASAMLRAEREEQKRALQDMKQMQNDALRQAGTNMLERLRERRSLEDRVQGDVLGRRSTPRLIDVMNASNAASETKEAARIAEAEARNAEKQARLVKANAMLQAEIEEQKTRMDTYEQDKPGGAEKSKMPAASIASGHSLPSESSRHLEKIRDLRKELDLAYKQSSANSEGHVDTIRKLEKRLQASSEGRSEMSEIEKKKYIKKIKALREELDVAFKQSSINSEMQVERIRELEKELERAHASSKPVESVQAEGDMSANVIKFANHGKWYKQEVKGTSQIERELKSLNKLRDQALSDYDLRAGSAYEQRAREAKADASASETHPIDQALAAYEQRASQRKQDQALVEEVRDIYESRYGKIDVSHRQTALDKALEAHETRARPQNNVSLEAQAVETDESPGNTLTEYERGEKKYAFQRDNLDAELAHQNKAPEEAHSTMDKEVYGTRTVDGDIQHPLHASTMHGLEWEEPPVYKVLAYDSGNNFLVTSTTSTNFTGKEIPISIPETLSQLYQPARFIPEFAELQKQGFQVIHGTKDLLVFRKAKSQVGKSAEKVTTLHDHGLVIPAVEPTASESAPRINPVDKTGYGEPATGSFASPTGFVGDRWETEATATASKDQQVIDRDTDIRHYPRITRQEQVFSGSRLKSSKKDRSRSEENEQRRKYRGWRQSAKWALLSGLAAGAAAYSIGAAAERSRERDYEKWQRLLAEQRSIGGLGADGKRLQQGGGGIFWK